MGGKCSHHYAIPCSPTCSKRKSLMGIKRMRCCAMSTVTLFFRAIWASCKLCFSWWNKMAAGSYRYPYTAVPGSPQHLTFALWWQGCRVLLIPNAYSCRLKLPLVGISARLCSNKNWRKPSALNLWNSGCPAYDFYKKGKLFWLPARKSLLLKDSLAQLAITPHLEYMYFKVSLKLLSHQRVHRKSFKFFNQIFWFISHQ